ATAAAIMMPSVNSAGVYSDTPSLASDLVASAEPTVLIAPTANLASSSPQAEDPGPSKLATAAVSRPLTGLTQKSDVSEGVDVPLLQQIGPQAVDTVIAQRYAADVA